MKKYFIAKEWAITLFYNIQAPQKRMSLTRKAGHMHQIYVVRTLVSRVESDFLRSFKFLLSRDEYFTICGNNA